MLAVLGQVARDEAAALLPPRLPADDANRERAVTHGARGPRALVLAHEPARGAGDRAHAEAPRLRLVGVRGRVRHPRVRRHVEATHAEFFSRVW